MDEVIRAIEQTDIENMQDVVQAVMCRHKERYPHWQILFLSAEVGARDERSRAILELIDKAEEMVTKF